MFLLEEGGRLLSPRSAGRSGGGGLGSAAGAQRPALQPAAASWAGQAGLQEVLWGLDTAPWGPATHQHFIWHPTCLTARPRGALPRHDAALPLVSPRLRPTALPEAPRGAQTPSPGLSSMGTDREAVTGSWITPGSPLFTDSGRQLLTWKEGEPGWAQDEGTARQALRQLCRLLQSPARLLQAVYCCPSIGDDLISRG